MSAPDHRELVERDHAKLSIRRQWRQCELPGFAFGTKCSIPNILWRDVLAAAKPLIYLNLGMASVPRVRISSRPPVRPRPTFSVTLRVRENPQ